ncbi:MAG: DUF465 domain-containing protein [Deferribacterales bacterium]
MLRTETAIVEKLCQSNAEFKELFDNHIRYEQDLEALYSLKYFPPEVEAKMKELKVMKLRGKERIEQMIIKYKSENGL